jgi:hypothetical protein
MTDVFRKIETVRAADDLTAAFVASDSVLCLEYDFYTLLIDYTRAAAGGGVTWKVEFSLDDGDWYQASLCEADTAITGGDATSDVQREQFSYMSSSADQELFTFGPKEINQFAKYIRVSAVEAGQVDPGECGIQMVLTRRKQVAMN